jgi:hypothetical protein
MPTPSIIHGLVLMPHQFTPWGQVVPCSNSELLRFDTRELRRWFPTQQYIYAKAGDYIGLLRKGDGRVDFKISPHHALMSDPSWQERVLALLRVVHVAYLPTELQR